MKYSVQFFGLPSDQYLPLTVRAEELGFSGLWLADHVVTPREYTKDYPYAASGDPGYQATTPLTDVAVTLGYLAGRTSKITLGSGVFVLPMRNPFHVARSFAALQNLSAGRLLLGIGTGWMREEFDAVGEDFATRGARTDEALQILRLLWSGSEVSFEGKHYSFPPLHFAGAPSSPIPFVFGGHSPVALRRAARWGSGWFGPNLDLESSLELIKLVDDARVTAKRDHEVFTHYVRLVGDLTMANVDRYATAGVQHLVFSPFNRPGIGARLGDRLEALEEVAADLQIGSH